MSDHSRYMYSFSTYVHSNIWTTSLHSVFGASDSHEEIFTVHAPLCLFPRIPSPIFLHPPPLKFCFVLEDFSKWQFSKIKEFHAPSLHDGMQKYSNLYEAPHFVVFTYLIPSFKSCRSPQW